MAWGRFYARVASIQRTSWGVAEWGLCASSPPCPWRARSRSRVGANGAAQTAYFAFRTERRGSRDCARANLRRACPGLSLLRSLRELPEPYSSTTPLASIAFDSAEGLAGRFFVLDQGEADVVWPEDRMMAQTEEVVTGRRLGQSSAKGGRYGPRDCTEGIDGCSIGCGRGLACVGSSAGTVNAQRELAEDGSFARDRHDHRRPGIHRFLRRSPVSPHVCRCRKERNRRDRRHGRCDVLCADTTSRPRRQSRAGGRRPHLLDRCRGLGLTTAQAHTRAPP